MLKGARFTSARVLSTNKGCGSVKRVNGAAVEEGPRALEF